MLATISLSVRLNKHQSVELKVSAPAGHCSCAMSSAVAQLRREDKGLASS